MYAYHTDLLPTKAAFSIETFANVLQNFLSLVHANCFDTERSPNLSDLDFDLSRSLKVKYGGLIGLPIYRVLLMFNSNIGPS